jgi:hypothetical protein
MKAPICSREFEIVEEVGAGRWPEQSSAELRRHVEGCPVCRDVILVAEALHEEYARALQGTVVPDAGLVWRRAELRARQQAIRAAERPISLVHAFGGACAFGVSIALVGRVLPQFGEWLNALANLPAVNLLLAALGALVLAAPIALYFVFSDK